MLGGIYLQSNIYNESLNDFSRKYLIKGKEPLMEDVRRFPIEFKNQVHTIGEQLLVHDAITFKVYGENIPLSILIANFGLRNFEELLEQDAINFLLWSNDISYAVDDIPGLHPLQSMSFSSSVHTDPEESIYYGMKFMLNPLPRKIRRDLIRKVSKNYIVPPNQLAVDSVKFGHEGYQNNLFDEFGLTNYKELNKLNREERKLLCNLATQCYNLTLLSNYQLGTYNSPELLKLNRAEFNQLKNVNAIENVVDTIFNFEKVPSFSEMIKNGIIDIKDVPKMRENKSARKFRKWIESISDNNDRDEIIREYMNAIINSKSILETPQGKLTRVLSVTALGGVVGTAIAGPVGTASGAIIGAGLDVGISLLDSYVLDGLIKGWTPKYYIDKQVRPLI